MNKKVNIGANLFRYLLTNYKDYFLPFAVIAVSLVIFINFTIPQIKKLTDMNGKIREENKKLEIMRSNLDKLSTINVNALDSQLAISSRALPSEKDFSAVLNAVSAAAAKSQVGLGDYGFEVGDIKKVQSDVKYPGFKLILNVASGPEGVQKFISELCKTVPISEVIGVKSSPVSSEVTAIFYYKAIPPIEIKDDVPIKLVSEDGALTLAQISTWTNSQAQNELLITPVSASSSGSLKSSPF